MWLESFPRMLECREAHESMKLKHVTGNIAGWKSSRFMVSCRVYEATSYVRSTGGEIGNACDAKVLSNLYAFVFTDVVLLSQCLW